MTNVIRRSDEGNYIFSEKLLPGIKEENLRFIVSVQHPQGHTRKKKKKNFFRVSTSYQIPDNFFIYFFIRGRYMDVFLFKLFCFRLIDRKTRLFIRLFVPF